MASSSDSGNCIAALLKQIMQSSIGTGARNSGES